MKLYPLFAFLFFFSIVESHAQFSKLVSVGVGGGGTVLHGDFSKAIGYGGHVDLEALLTPFISVGINGQVGKLSGDSFPYGKIENNYVNVNGNVKVRAGQFLGLPKNYSYYILSDNSLLSYLSNFYLGTGFGIISSDVVANLQDVDGVDQSTELIVPLNVGIDFPLGQSLYGPTWAVNMNFSYVGNSFDGFLSSVEDIPDHYSYFSLGVKVALFNRR